MNHLSRSFFNRDTSLVAQELLGAYLIRRQGEKYIVGRIVETEAYTSNDPACHAHKGKTDRNSSLFGPVGHAYVYMSYGIHYCLNIVAHNEDVEAGGVLIRALEPVQGIDTMRLQRGYVTDRELTNGPGKLAQACMIDRRFDGYDIIEGDALSIARDDAAPQHVWQAGPRIGISKAQDIKWRFYMVGNAWVSR
jgi:DNA-3-methyladenine glycosylase